MGGHGHEEHSTEHSSEHLSEHLSANSLEHATEHSSEHGHHDHFNIIYIGVLVLLGFLFFFVAEKIASLHMPHTHEHSDEHTAQHSAELVDKVYSKDHTDNKEHLNEGTKEIIISDNTSKDLRRKLSKPAPHHTPHTSPDGNIIENHSNNGIFYYFPSLPKLNPSGWLNLLADSMHNFTDGIALGTDVLSLLFTVCFYVFLVFAVFLGRRIRFFFALTH